MPTAIRRKFSKHWLGLGFALLSSGSAAALAQQAEFDIVIRHGRVIDGAGNPWVRADVAVKDGVIAAVGAVEGRGRQEIDARDLYVTPGWIDMMDQSGRALLTNGRAANKVLMGVTTAIAGEGGTPVEACQLADYFGQLETNGISINFGSYYATHQARLEVMGDQAGAPSEAQLNSMKAKVAEAMRAGARGVATALIYPPASFQSTEDLVQLASVAGQAGGLYASHIRDESADLLSAISESIEIGRRSGARVEIFHLKAAYAPGWGTLMEKAGQLIADARAEGIDIAADVYPYTAGGTGLSITVPNWVFADGAEIGIKRLRDPKVREHLKRELEAGSQSGWSNLVLAAGGWENVVLANAHSAEYQRFEGRSITDVAAELGRHPADAAWDIVLAAYPKRAMALFHLMSEEDVEKALGFAWTSIGSDAGIPASPGELSSDGLAHPRAYGTFPRIISKYVRDRSVLTLEEAVRKMTSWPAARMGLSQRGLVRVGMAADLTLFDFTTIADKATYEQPTQPAVGISYVLVNGRLVVEEGRHTGATPGVVLKGPGYHPPGPNDVSSTVSCQQGSRP